MNPIEPKPFTVAVHEQFVSIKLPVDCIQPAKAPVISYEPFMEVIVMVTEIPVT